MNELLAIDVFIHDSYFIIDRRKLIALAVGGLILAVAIVWAISRKRR